MTIREESFRIGCGRYIQGKGYIEKCGEEEINRTLISLMKEHNMPYKLCDIGVTVSEEYFEKFYEKLLKSSAIDETNNEECQRLHESLKYLWNM